MPAIMPNSRRYMASIVVALILFAMVGYFYVVHVPQSGEAITETNFRSLRQINRNIDEKISSYRTVAKNRADFIIHHRHKSLNIYKRYPARPLPGFIRFSTEKTGDTISKKGKEKSPEQLILQTESIAVVYLAGEWQFVIKDSLPDTIPRPKLDYSGKRRVYIRYYFTTPLQDFISPLIRTYAFDHYFIENNGNIVFESLPAAGIRIKKTDSLVNNKGGFLSSVTRDLEIGGVNYKLFLQPMRLYSNDYLTLCGMERSDKFDEGRMQIPSQFIIYILILLLLFFLSLPLWKLQLISKRERLDWNDILISGLAFMACTALVIYMMLDMHFTYKTEDDSRSVQLKDFSKEISASFCGEIDTLVHQARYFDSLAYQIDSNILRYNNKFYFAKKELKDSKLIADKTIYNKIDSIYKKNQFFGEMACLNNKGSQVRKFSSDSVLSDTIPLFQRPYFKDVVAHHFMRLSSDTTLKFTMQSVVSWTDNNQEAVIAYGEPDSVPYKHPSKEKHIMTIVSSRLRSVIDPLLPQGTGFCIFDESGLVQFHSNKILNTQENFMEECGNPGTLKAGLWSHAAVHFNAVYHGRRTLFEVSPVKGMPYYLAVWQESQYQMSENSGILTMSLLYYISFISVFFLLLAFVRVFKPKIEKSLIKTYFLDWLYPVKTNAEHYKRLALFFIQIIACVIIFEYWVLTSHLEKEWYISVYLIMALALAYAFLAGYFVLGTYPGKIKQRHIKYFAVVLVVFNLIITRIIILDIHTDLWGVFVFQALLFGLGFLNLKVFTANEPERKTWKFSYNTHYTLMVFSWLGLISIVPGFVFFAASYNIEKEYSMRHYQLALAKAAMASVNENKDPVFSAKGKKLEIYKKGAKHAYFKSFDETRVAGQFPEPANTRDSFTANTTKLEKINPGSDSVSILNKFLLRDVSDDRQWGWKKTDTSDMLTLWFNNPQQNQRYQITSIRPMYPLPNFIKPEGDNGICFFWLDLVLLLIIVFFALRHVIIKVFIINVESVLCNVNMDIAMFEKIHRPGSAFRYYLIGLPMIGRLNFIEERLNAAGKVPFIIDALKANLADTWTAELERFRKAKPETVIINNFDAAINDLDINHLKLLFLEEISELNINVIIISTIDTSAFDAIYQARTGDEAAQFQKYLYDKERWQKGFSCYYKVYLSMRNPGSESTNLLCEPKNFSLLTPKKKTLYVEMRMCAEAECNNGAFLRTLLPEICDFINDNFEKEHFINEEDVVLKVQNHSAMYYNDIWNSCTENEKYLIHDIAQDGFLNYKNIEGMNSLLSKGILYVHEKTSRLTIFNKSFRNFILSLPWEVTQKLEKDAALTGGWSGFKTPVLIMLTAVAVFIMVTQHEIYNQSLALFSAVATGLPIIMRVTALFTIPSKSNNPNGA